MAKYSYITDKTHNNRKIQVESAKRDGSGKNIENNYAKQNGNYQSLTAGLSNNFDTKKVMVDESAYNFRQTATMGSVELEVGSPCKVKKIIGGTIVFNQLIKNGNFEDNSNWQSFPANVASLSVSNNKATISVTQGDGSGWQYGLLQTEHTFVQGHKYHISCNIESAQMTSFMIEPAGTNGVGIGTGNISIVINIEQVVNSNFLIFPLNNYGTPGNSYSVSKVQCIDLTQMFGSTIADYIYSLEQANAGSGVAWFKRYFPKEYYAYNSGELVSVKTQGKKITHFNQWDEQMSFGYYWGEDSNGDATKVAHNDRCCSTNLIKVIPNAVYYFRAPTPYDSAGGADHNIAYYDADQKIIGTRGWLPSNRTFTTPINCYYIGFTLSNKVLSYNHDICINFHYDGERDGEYEPYNSETYACDDIELRGIPQLDENNNLAFDGDEYANDGNVTRKYGIVDLGTLTWTYNATYGVMSCPIPYKTTSTGAPMLISSKGNLVSSSTALSSMNNNDFRAYYFNYPNDIVWKTDETDPTTFKNSLSGVYLVYELATPTDENSIPFTEVQECDNWGTEEWLAPTTDTRPCEVPVGHETDYLPDLKAKLEVAPNTPNENGVYVMEHNASGNSYTPIATWLTNNGYKTEEAMKDTFGMKDALGGTLRQLLATKESIDFINTDIIDLGSLSWLYLSQGFFSASVPNIKITTSVGENTKILCSKYQNGTSVFDSGMADVPNLTIHQGVNDTAIKIKDTSLGTDATAFKNAMKGVLLAYEKAS